MSEERNAASSGGMRRAYLGLRGLQEIGVLVALITLCVVLTFTTVEDHHSKFLTSLNLMQVARQASYYGIMAVGMVFVISMGDH